VKIVSARVPPYPKAARPTGGTSAKRIQRILYFLKLTYEKSTPYWQLLYPSNDRLYAVRIDGTGLRTVALASSGRIWAGCDWSPQGNRIAARTTGTSLYDNELSVFNSDGSAARTVYSRRAARVGNPVFSVNGQQLLFSADSTDFQNEQGRQLDARLYGLSLTSGAVADLSQHQVTTSAQNLAGKTAGTNDLDPRYSPTGASVIFTNTDNTGIGQRNVYTADAGCKKLIVLWIVCQYPVYPVSGSSQTSIRQLGATCRGSVVEDTDTR
jgi:dipeptidyl aminopeptidase/acylaminoacyl peptidase